MTKTEKKLAAIRKKVQALVVDLGDEIEGNTFVRLPAEIVMDMDFLLQVIGGEVSEEVGAGAAEE